VTNICTGVGVHDVITSANFYDCRLWGLSVVGGQILGFSIDSRFRPYNTLALPCECVIWQNKECARSESSGVAKRGGQDSRNMGRQKGTNSWLYSF